MTQMHFTLNQKELQRLIEGSVKNDFAKIVFTYFPC
jgi:hypothetical protein